MDENLDKDTKYESDLGVLVSKMDFLSHQENFNISEARGLGREYQRLTREIMRDSSRSEENLLNWTNKLCYDFGPIYTKLSLLTYAKREQNGERF